MRAVTVSLVLAMGLGKPTLQIPQATVHSSLVAEAWLAWHSMQRSMMWLRQMAQLSTTMSHAQRATAFHYASLAYRACPLRNDIPTFLTSNRFLSPSVLAPALAVFALGATGASVMFTSAMFAVWCRVSGEVKMAVRGARPAMRSGVDTTGV